VRFDYKNISEITLIGWKVQTRESIYESFACIGMASGAIWDRMLQKALVEQGSQKYGTIGFNQTCLKWFRIGPEWSGSSTYNI
jgi:hypothetical protein